MGMGRGVKTRADSVGNVDNVRLQLNCDGGKFGYPRQWVIITIVE